MYVKVILLSSAPLFRRKNSSYGNVRMRLSWLFHDVSTETFLRLSLQEYPSFRSTMVLHRHAGIICVKDSSTNDNTRNLYTLIKSDCSLAAI